MKVQLSDENEAKLVEIAAAQGSNPDSLAEEVLESYVESRAKLIASLKLGDEAIRSGEYFTDEEVSECIERLLRT